jgi:hypothetical protein
VNRVIVLDSAPLGALANPVKTKTSLAAQAWLRARVASGDIVVIPEIADYEVRRELLRAGFHLSVKQLDSLRVFLNVIPIDGRQLLEAAGLWAEARNLGRPAEPDIGLDADMILVAQSRAAAAFYGNENNTIIATTNPRHLELFADARVWNDIT